MPGAIAVGSAARAMKPIPRKESSLMKPAKDRETSSAPTFRLDVQLYEPLTEPVSSATLLLRVGEPQMFSNLVFPEDPEMLGFVDNNRGWKTPECRHLITYQNYRNMSGWLFSYIRSHVASNEASEM